jgi:hypothetical protein
VTSFLVGDEGFNIKERGRGGEDCLEEGLLRTRAVVLGDGISSSIACIECEKGSSISSSSDSH